MKTGRALISSVTSSPSLASWLSPGQFQNSAAGGTDLQASELEYDAEQSGVLKITIAEGDTVSISFAALSQLQSESASAATGGSTASIGSADSSSAFAVAVQVSGSLNGSEQADINKLVSGLFQAMQDESNGDGTQAAQDLQSIGSLNSLRSFQFAWQQQTQDQAGTLSVLA
jgi:hypothetical protein